MPTGSDVARGLRGQLGRRAWTLLVADADEDADIARPLLGRVRLMWPDRGRRKMFGAWLLSCYAVRCRWVWRGGLAASHRTMG
jgi:hypothetical protein